MGRAYWFLVAGLMLFLAGATLVVLAMGRADDGLVEVGLVALAGAVLCLGIGAWQLRHQVDRTRIGAEQRLWSSGPLGRAWLRIRKRRR